MNTLSFHYFWQVAESPWIFECSGEAFPRVIFSTRSGMGGGSRKLSFLKHVGRRAQFFSSLGPVKTKRKVTVTSFTGTVTSNPVSHCSYCSLSTSSSSGLWGSSLPTQPSSRPGPHTQGQIPGHFQTHKSATVLLTVSLDPPVV